MYAISRSLYLLPLYVISSKHCDNGKYWRFLTVFAFLPNF